MKQASQKCNVKSILAMSFSLHILYCFARTVINHHYCVTDNSTIAAMQFFIEKGEEMAMDSYSGLQKLVPVLD